MFVLCFPLQSQASKKFQNFILGQVRDAGNSLLHCCEVVRGNMGKPLQHAMQDEGGLWYAPEIPEAVLITRKCVGIWQRNQTEHVICLEWWQKNS